MKTNKKLCSLVLSSVTLVLLLILLSPAVSAGSPTVNETQVTTSGSAYNPAIWKDKIAWQDGRNGNSDIYVYNLSNDSEIRITTSGRAFDPRIHGNNIVWSDQRNLGQDSLAYGDVYLYDLSTSNETQITTGGLVWGSPAIYGDRIVYLKDEDRYTYDHDIYMYDLSTSVETRITTGGEASDFSIYHDRIIYSILHNGISVYMYNLSTSQEIQIPISGNVWMPEIYNNRIVWYDTRNIPTTITFDVNMYDLSTSQQTQITNGGNSFYPVIYDNVIVWQNNTVNPADIYMYNISNSEVTQITTSGNAYSPAIYDNKIVWVDERNGSSDIYMGTVSYPQVNSYPPVAAFCACSISGKAPLTLKFKDKSTGSPASWFWNFGDKCTSTAQNPTHKYSKAGKYTVSLTVKNAAGSDTKKISNYITVK